MHFWKKTYDKFEKDMKWLFWQILLKTLLGNRLELDVYPNEKVIWIVIWKESFDTKIAPTLAYI